MLVIGWLFVSSFIGLHATDNEKTGWWGLVVFLFGIFGLVGYAISLASD